MFQSLAIANVVSIPEASQMKALLATLIQQLQTYGPGKLNIQSTSVATSAGTSEEVAHTFSLPAAYLTTLGTNTAIRISAFGLFAATGNSKTVKLYFGAAVITTGSVAGNNVNWWIQLTVIRSGTSTQMVTGKAQYGTTMITPYFVAATEDETAAIVIKSSMTDASAAAGDTVAKGFLVEVIQ